MDAGTLIAAICAVIAVTWVLYYAWGEIEKSHRVCMCGHIFGRHVSPLDYDSDYGNPGRMGGVAADYKKPRSCRDCWGRCRTFIEKPGDKPRLHS